MVTATETKKPWQMTQSELRKVPVNSFATPKEMEVIKSPEFGKEDLERFLKDKHREIVKEALSKGKLVPQEVLKDYPDLKPVPPEPKVEKPLASKLLEQAYYDWASKDAYLGGDDNYRLKSNKGRKGITE